MPQEIAVRFEDTNEVADSRLTPHDGIRILSHVHRRLLSDYPVDDEFDLVDRLDAERDCISPTQHRQQRSLMAAIHNEAAQQDHRAV